jgi:hypothetical protein
MMISKPPRRGSGILDNSSRNTLRFLILGCCPKRYDRIRCTVESRPPEEDLLYIKRPARIMCETPPRERGDRRATGQP